MKSLKILLSLVAIFGALTLGYSYVSAAQPDQDMFANCQTEFHAMNTSNDGMLNYQEYKIARYGLGGHKGLAPTGASVSAFNSADRDGNGFLSEGEFCAWSVGRNRISG
jgi:hypothetical protein